MIPLAILLTALILIFTGGYCFGRAHELRARIKEERARKRRGGREAQ